MRRLVLPLVLALTLGACGDDELQTHEERVPGETAVERPPDPEPDEPAQPPPLAEPREIRFESDDGVTLVGDLRAAEDPSAPLIVLVHQLSSDRSEWLPLLRRLTGEPEVSTFAMDMRGHGDSTQRGEETLSWQDFDASDWDKTPGDVIDAIEHLREEEPITPRRIMVVGSSIGSSAALLAAAREPSIDVVVALSPGRAYHGLDVLTPLPELGERPVLAVAARGEAQAAEAAEDIGNVARGGRALLVDGSRHGVGMFEQTPSSLDEVVSFLREHAADGG